MPWRFTAATDAQQRPGFQTPYNYGFGISARDPLTSLYSAQDDGVDLRLRQFITGVSLDLALSACMFRGGLLLALGLFTICSPLAAQQAKHSGITKHRAAVPAIAPLDGVSKPSIYRPNVTTASKSILLQSGPVRAWSDGTVGKRECVRADWN